MNSVTSSSRVNNRVAFGIPGIRCHIALPFADHWYGMFSLIHSYTSSTLLFEKVRYHVGLLVISILRSLTQLVFVGGILVGAI